MKPDTRRRWWDRQHRQDCAIGIPLGAGGFVVMCLLTGCPITLWQALVPLALIGGVFGAVLIYILPPPR